jgi:cytochrome c oxidase cbb3-type subunit 3
MNKKPDGKPLDHEYDGIQELDNQLPRWWLILFYVTIVFGVFYIAHYHFGPGKHPAEELKSELAAIREHQRLNAPADTGPDEAMLTAILADKSKLEIGNKQFGEKCASCHGVKGEGLIGPNLTDRYWLHGNSTLPDIFKVVADGVPEKGMPPWKALLKPEELNAVVAYVKHLEGTNPPGAKEAQGTEIK